MTSDIRHSIWPLTAMLAALLTAACSSSSTPAPEEPSTPPAPEDTTGRPIGFRAALSDVATPASGTTRAAGDGELTTELLKQEGFGVYCWHTGTDDFTTPQPATQRDGSTQPYTLLMRNQRCWWEAVSPPPAAPAPDGRWTYSPSKYWPLNPAGKLTLRAYAPYTDYLVTDATGMPLLPVVVAATDYHLGTQHDPLWGTGRLVQSETLEYAEEGDPRYGTLYDNITYEMSGDWRKPHVPADTRDGTIDWFFHHGMSSLMFTVSVIADPGCDAVTITGITIAPLYDQGLLDLGSATTSASDKPTWTERDGTMTVNLQEGDPKTSAGDLAPLPTPDPEPLDFKPYPFTITTGSTATEPIPLLSRGLLIIPRTYNETTPMTVTITYYLDGVASDPQQARGVITRSFDGNTAYNLGLTLTPETKGLEIDIVQGAFTNWLTGGTVTKEVYNW